MLKLTVLIALFFFGITLFLILPQPGKPWTNPGGCHHMADKELIELPQGLENTVLKRFDELVGKGSILFEPSQADYVQHHGFQISRKVEVMCLNFLELL